MKTFSKEAYLSLDDEDRESYTSEQFSHELKQYLDKAIHSPTIQILDLSGLIFPRGFIFNLVDYLPNSEVKNHKKCDKIILAKNVIFSGNVSFTNVEFLQDVDFENTEFCLRAVFNGARFHKDVNFSGVNFYRQANFAKSEFLLSSSPNFYHCRFHEIVTFAEAKFQTTSDIVFDYSTFKGIAFFNSIHFQGKATFANSKFEGTCNMSYTDFVCGGRFSGAEFQKLARFTSIKVKGQLDFLRTSFAENCLLNHLHFKDGGKIKFDDLGVLESTRIVVGSIDSVEVQSNRKRKNELINFEHFSVILDSPTIVVKDCKSCPEDVPILKFENCFVERGAIRFENCDLTYIENFISADQRIFDAFAFKNCDLPKQSPPHLFLPFMLELSTIDNFEEGRTLWNLLKKNFTLSYRLNKAKLRKTLLQKFAEQKANLARRRKEKYAFLKADAEHHGDSQLASDFFFSQMYWANIEKATFANSIYYSLSGYGLSWFRPCVTFCSVFLVSFFIFFLIHFTRMSPPGIECETSNLLCEVTALFTRADHFIPVPLGLSILASSPMPVDLYVIRIIELADKQVTAWQLVLTFLFYVPQKVLQLFSLFEFGAAIRNKVKR
ncbi:MAG: pentapeptide repeat-containing protein [Candidatus Caenarcaniphilales bacterium]|nr:pentapeptide repeat-containing protein [Candidatus Caenarcaniphilales bacterium]